LAALLGTVAGTVLLVGAKFGAAPTGQAGTDPAAVADANATSEGATAAGDPSAAPAPGVPGVPATSGAPAASAAPGSSAAPAKPTGGTTAGPTPTKATTTTAPPASTCTKANGSAVGISKPGIGTITVTITVCNGAITTSAGAQSASNWDKNGPAVPALNSLAVKYYKTNFSAIHYSGASLTSAAYQSSLRSAMGKAGL